MVRTVLSYLFEALGVVVLAVALWVLFGWAWALVPVGVFLLVLGFTVDGGDR